MNQNEGKPFQPAAEAAGLEERAGQHQSGHFHNGKSHSPGLRAVPNSFVPGTDRAHVHGPQQSPVDPVAAGLDTEHVPPTRAENRVIDRTGEIASGPHAAGPIGVSDGSQVVAPADDQPPINEPSPEPQAEAEHEPEHPAENQEG